jgi:hypothetical protein
MTRLIFILTVIFIITGLTSFQITTKTGVYDWGSIKEFKFYGFVDPTENNKAKFILADTDKIKKIFSKLKQSDGFLPKGASRFATIKFDNNKKITIQIIAGGHLPFRVIKKDLFTDHWFDLEDSLAIEWTNYINELTEKMGK